MFIYYVYAYINKKTGLPYYIGKGKDCRAYTKQNHSISVPKDKSKIVFLEKNLSEIGALALERRYIKWFGRKDLGTGILLNKTDGGEGVAGRIVSENTKLKISNSNKGKLAGDNNPSKRLDVREKLSLPRKKRGRKIVVRTPLKGRTYEEIYGIEKAKELKRIKSEQKKGKKLINYKLPSKIECSHCNKLYDPGNLKRHLNRLAIKADCV